MRRWRLWNAKWGEELYHEVGLIVALKSPLTPGTFPYDSYHTLKNKGYALQDLNEETVRKRFPKWRSDVYKHGYFNPLAGWAESGKVVERLLREAVQQGITLKDGMMKALLYTERCAPSSPPRAGSYSDLLAPIHQFVCACVLVC